MVGYNHKLTIYETPAVADDTGGFTEGTELEIIDLWGDVKERKQRRVLENGALLTSTYLEITCRWFTEFDTFGASDDEFNLDWRIKFDSKTYQIHTIENVGFNNRIAKISCLTI